MANDTTKDTDARADKGTLVLSTDLIKNWKPPRRVKGPIVSRAGGDAVRVLGEALNETLWLGSEWAVTTYGVERRDGKFAIKHDWLEDEFSSFGWQSTFDELWRLDADDFGTAILVCAALHGHMLTQDDVRRLRKFVETRRGEASR